MAELADLAVRMRTLAAGIPAAANELKKQVVRTIETDLVYVTPVDTSQALSNWQVDTKPIDTFIPPHFPGELGSTQAQSAQEAIQDMEAVLSGVQPGQPVFVGNAAPYINKLDQGSSQQEPAGFVDRAILLGRKVLQAANLVKE